MSNVFDTATDANAPPLPVGKTDAPVAAGAPPKSFDDLTYDKVNAADLSLTKQKIGAEAGMEAARKRKDDAYEALQQRLITAEGATMDDIKPWNAEKELNDRKTNLWDQFGSPGFVIAMIASSFSGTPMNSALNAGAAAMNAINEGDMDRYHKAFDAWKENSNLTLKRLDLEEHQFGQIENLRTKSAESYHAAATALASRFNDQRLLIMLNAGLDGPVQEALAARAKSKIELADARQRLLDNDIRMRLINSDPDYKSGDPKKMAAAIHRADDAMRGDDAKMTPDQRFQLLWHQQHPEGTYQEFSDAYDKFKRDQYIGRGGAHGMQGEIDQRNIRWDAEHPDASEAERDAAHDANIKDVKQANAPPITGNKRVDLESHLGQYDDALKLIDGIDKVLNKYAGAAGVAGRATRLGERVGNILGSNSTDRTQMMRDIEQLQVMGPRLLLDQKTGRPLSIEAGKISDIIAGLNLGDTTANTLRAMKELKERLSTIRDRDKSQMGGPAPKTALPVTEDKPWENDPIQK